jgi:dTDP-4-amino-4,6-dideoxygalactose transaminase
VNSYLKIVESFTNISTVLSISLGIFSIPLGRENGAGHQHIWNQYTVRAVAGEKWNRQQTPRNASIRLLQEGNIGSEIYNPLPMHVQECLASSVPHAAAPASEALAALCLCIPASPELTPEEQGTVIEALTDSLHDNA